MIKQIEFIQNQFRLAKIFLRFDSKIHKELKSKLAEMFSATDTVSEEIDDLIDTLKDLRSLLLLPADQRLQKRDTILVRKMGLSIRYVQNFVIDRMLDDLFYMNTNYARLFKSELPLESQSVYDSVPLFREVSVCRYNYGYLIDTLKNLDENKPDELDKMIQILE